MRKIVIGICIATTLIGGIYFYETANAPKPLQTNQQEPSIVPPGERGMVGASIPVAVARFETSLQSKLTSSANSMTLTSDPLFTKIGTSLSGYVCFTIDEGTTVVEDVCGTASGTAISSLTRGMSPLTGTSSVAALAFEHRKGASVKITDAPQLLVVSRILNGNELLPNPLKYDPSITTTTLSSNTSYVASVAYANSLAFAGAPTATGTTPGLIELASRTQLSAGTAMDGAYTLVPQNAYFNSTFQSATTVPVTGANGKLAQNFLDLTQAWTFTATTTLAATSAAPLVLRGNNYVFPAAQGAASTTLFNDGSGNLVWNPAVSFLSFAPSFGTTMGTASLLATASATTSTASRLMITGIGTFNTATQGTGSDCNIQLTIDDAATTTVSSVLFNWGGGGTYSHRAPANFTYISNSLASGTHMIRLYGTSAVNTCTYGGVEMAVFNAGN